MRKLAIGKKVRVVPEYKRAFAVGDGPQREMTFVAVMTASEKNLAALLLEQGLASVSRHGQADERSAYYEDLLQAEEAARAAKKGVHSTAEPPRSKTTDLASRDSADRAKRFLSALQRHGRVRGIVQYIPNGSRFKVLISKENCLISLAIAGLRCP